MLGFHFANGTGVFNTGKMHLYKILPIITALILPFSCYGNGEPMLRASTDLASEGFITLLWNPLGESVTPVRLQIFDTRQPDLPLRDMTLREQTQVHLSGFVDGRYSAQLYSSGQQAIGEPVSFTVQHRDLGVALALFSLGLALFLLLITLVLRFSHRPG